MLVACATAVKVAAVRFPPVSDTMFSAVSWVVPFGRSPVAAGPVAAVVPDSGMNVNSYVVSAPLFTIMKPVNVLVGVQGHVGDVDRRAVPRGATEPVRPSHRQAG